MAFSFLFPGQGSQYTGMFENHFEEFEEFQKNLSIAEEFYKEDLKSIIFHEILTWRKSCQGASAIFLGCALSLLECSGVSRDEFRT